MSDQSYPQWRNANTFGKYPFASSATMSNGEQIIADSLFTDARFYPVGGQYDLYMSSIVKSQDRVDFYFSDSGTLDLCYGGFDISTVASLSSFNVYDKYSRDAGVLLTDVQRVSTILGWADGEYLFTAEQTPIVAAALTPVPSAGVTALIPGDYTEAFAEDVYLVGGVGVRLSVSKTDPSNYTITVDATGEPLFKRVLCQATTFTVPCYLQTINGHKADAYGNFYIGACGIDSTETVIRIEPSGNGLVIYSAGG